MSCRVTVRSSDAVQQWSLDEWTALVVLASLSSEPENHAELLAAMRRYQPDHRLQELGMAVPDLTSAVDGDMWCLVDLEGKTVVAGGGFDLPNMTSAFEPSPNEEIEGFPIVWLDTPSAWLFRADGDNWLDEVERRAAAASCEPRFDVRAVLFGDPLLEFLAERTVAAADQYRPSDENRELELTRSIHADWLMAERDDLGGRTPRQCLLADRSRIERDIEHRSQQWSRQGFAPPPLSTDASGYRFGGFGTIETVLYFDLVRSLLGLAWQLIVHGPTATPAMLVEALREYRDHWLSEPNEDSGMKRSPAELIEFERRRQPIVSDDSHLDCDCPICRAEAEGLFGPGPAFFFFDGHHLEIEDMFAFSLAESYQEWQQDRAWHQDFHRPEDTSAADKSADNHLDGHESESADSLDSVWKSSYVDWNSVAGADAPTSQSLFALAFPLAELITDLKGRRGGEQYVRSLNEAYDELRRSANVASSESSARQLADLLEKACHDFPALTSKCADFQSRLDEVLRRLV